MLKLLFIYIKYNKMINQTLVLKSFLNDNAKGVDAFAGFNFSYFTGKLAYKKSILCAICLKVCASPSKPSACNHIFCYPCIKKWAKIKKSCPICRIYFRKILPINF